MPLSWWEYLLNSESKGYYPLANLAKEIATPGSTAQEDLSEDFTYWFKKEGGGGGASKHQEEHFVLVPLLEF